MDSLTIDVFFSLLRNGLWNEPLTDFKPLSEKEWKDILSMGKKQTVVGLVAEAVSRLPKQLAPSQESMTNLLKFSTQSVMTHAKLDSAVAKVVAFYRKHGIEGVLLKGQGIARCYSNPLLRQCGDIDFYVGEENYAKSMELAISSLENDDNESRENEKHYHFNMDSIAVDLHRIAAQMATPLRRRKFRKWLEGELENRNSLRRIDINGTEVFVPSVNFNAFFIFYHAWWHFMHGGIGLRQLCDWAMVLKQHADTIDRNTLVELLRSLRYEKPWQILGSIVVERLGLPTHLMPLYDASISGKYKWVVEKVLDGGNFGFYGSDTQGVNLKRMPLLRRKKILLQRLMRTYYKISHVLPIESTCIVLRILAVSSIITVRQLLKGK